MIFTIGFFAWVLPNDYDIYKRLDFFSRYHSTTMKKVLQLTETPFYRHAKYLIVPAGYLCSNWVKLEN